MISPGCNSLIIKESRQNSWYSKSRLSKGWHSWFCPLLMFALAGCGPSKTEQRAVQKVAESQGEIEILQKQNDALNKELEKVQAQLGIAQSEVSKLRSSQTVTALKELESRTVTVDAFLVVSDSEIRKLEGLEIYLYQQANLFEYIRVRNIERDSALKLCEIKIKESLQRRNENYLLSKKLEKEILGFSSKKKETQQAQLFRARKVIVEEDEKLRGYGREEKHIQSGVYYFDRLPPPLKIFKTDAQGRVSITLDSRGDFAVVASYRRTDTNFRPLFWFLAIPNESGKTTHLILTNTNLTTSGTGILSTKF
jgi:hypothetical protein